MQLSDKLRCDYITVTQKADISIQYRTYIVSYFLIDEDNNIICYKIILVLLLFIHYFKVLHSR